MLKQMWKQLFCISEFEVWTVDRERAYVIQMQYFVIYLSLGYVLRSYLFIEGPRSRCYGRTAGLKACCATL
jgi:hypothetical protein